MSDIKPDLAAAIAAAKGCDSQFYYLPGQERRNMARAILALDADNVEKGKEIIRLKRELEQARAELQEYRDLRADFPILEQHNGQRVDWEWIDDYRDAIRQRHGGE